MNAIARPAFSQSTPSPPDFDSKSASGFFDDHTGSPLFLNTSNIPIPYINDFMPNSLDPRHSDSASSARFNLPDVTESIPWSGVSGGRSGAAGGVARPVDTRPSSHNRDPSSSSAGSAASMSSFQRSDARLRTGNRPGPRNPGVVRDRTIAHLSTPSQTHTKTSFSQPSAQTSGFATSPSKRARNLDKEPETPLLLRQSLLRSQTSIDDESKLMSHPERSLFATSAQEHLNLMSASGPLPNDTPRISQAGETDTLDIDAWLGEYLRLGQALDPMPTVMVADNGGDSYKNEYYLPQGMPRPAANPSYLMPSVNTMVQDRLNAANMARSASGSSSQSGPMSPFKANSQMYGSHLSALQDDGRDIQDLKYQVSPHMDSTPTTISPKDAMLEYHPGENETPLFSQPAFNAYSTVPSDPSKTATFRPEPPMAFSNLGSNIGPWTSALQPSTLAGGQMPAFGGYAAPMVPTIGSMTMSSQRFMSTQQGQAGQPSSTQVETTPEFPAHLISMESSASETGPQSNAASSPMNLASASKPNSHADTGTFSCTYHGCSQRFPSPQKLQRHKRDAHRSSSNVTPGIGSGMSAAQLLERNSQAGPHRCDRINPTTGKACNAIFSRPYDLTRHEDTIHNVRKQKVRCALCTEEKTFSRSDALTRHMRVVHPEVDFPGKHRRRGARGD